MAVVFCGKHLLAKSFQVIFVVATLVLLANANKNVIEKPRFTYVERHNVKITYENGVNRTLNVCCNGSSYHKDSMLAGAICGQMSTCPSYNTLSRCKTRGQQVCCEVSGVQDNIKIKGYVAWFDGKTSIPLSKTATYVTNWLEKIPKSVSEVNVTTNSQQGLFIRWTPLGRHDYMYSLRSNYRYLVHCKPRENRRAKAVRQDLEFTNLPRLVISSTNVTAVSKYRCCVQVVNLVTSLTSEETCQNITTSEQAPSASPVIICGNDTIECPSVIKGMKRDIKIQYQLPSPEHQNGKIMYHEVHYRNATAGNFTDFAKLVVNGSLTEAVITDVETEMGYDVFMKSCTKIGCSSVSNTVRIPGISNVDSVKKNIIIIVASTVGGLAFVFLVVVGNCIKRSVRLLGKEPLPELKQKSDPDYTYPDVKGKEDDMYLELESQPSEDSIHDDKDNMLNSQATVMSNPVALAAEQA